MTNSSSDSIGICDDLRKQLAIIQNNLLASQGQLARQQITTAAAAIRIFSNDPHAPIPLTVPAAGMRIGILWIEYATLSEIGSSTADVRLRIDNYGAWLASRTAEIEVAGTIATLNQQLITLQQQLKDQGCQ